MGTTFLEMRNPAEHRRKPWTRMDVEVREERDWRLNRVFYGRVGQGWKWTARSDWTEDQWRDYAGDPDVRTWIARRGDDLAGYCELRREGGEVEVAYFGLTPDFTGQGLGGELLSRMLDEAWGWGATRVWLHTCSLDHPGAVPNYLGRGMTVWKVVEEIL
jgi:GNAT superfamily N-acetyltransferase